MTILSFHDFCEKIPDLKENIINGSIKVIPLKKGKKHREIMDGVNESMIYLNLKVMMVTLG